MKTPLEANCVMCTRCIMNDVVDHSITFSAAGICCHCVRYDELVGSRVLGGEQGKIALDLLTNKIKKAGQGRDYDCVIGVSGGVDSTFTALLAKELGLRPLAVHLDNGWNSELAVSNIRSVLERLKIDLVTEVLDWEEFRDLQIAFLLASTPDGDVPTDHAINALLWREAFQRSIPYIISGMNFTTESISVESWSYGHSDWRYIRDIHTRFGKKPLRQYPHFSLAKLAWINLRGVRNVSLLNYIDYNKEQAESRLVSDLGWRPYGGKHYESIYTRFYQGHVLPQKFGIDKRFGHLSDLINAGQMSRDAALNLVAEPPYPLEEQNADRDYVLKKLQLSEETWRQIMAASPKSFRDYRNHWQTVQRLRRTVNWLRRVGLYPR